MTLNQAIKSAYSQYFGFAGRASRREFWLWVMFVMTILTGLAILGALTELAPPPFRGVVWDLVIFAYLIFWGGSLIPNHALVFRRLHDTDRSAWWLLISAIPLLGAVFILILMCLPGTEGPNRFGVAPRSGAAA